MTPGQDTVLVRGSVVIDVDRCKGCELCIPACPPQVLVMSVQANAAGYFYPELLVGCTGCRACREICPDFVFDVFKFKSPLLVDVSAGNDRASSEPSMLEL